MFAYKGESTTSCNRKFGSGSVTKNGWTARTRCQGGIPSNDVRQPVTPFSWSSINFIISFSLLLNLQKCSDWSKPDYSKCRIGLPCDPKKNNPCGCPDACCGFKPKPWWKGKITPIHGRKRRDAALEMTDEIASDEKGSYWCYKRGECHDRCGSVLGESHVKKCGCGKGLTCRKDHWYQVKRCRI